MGKVGEIIDAAHLVRKLRMSAARADIMIRIFPLSSYTRVI